MGERHAYYNRRLHSIRDPENVWSIIIDGMQQDHCYLPHTAGTKMFKNRLNQHILGVLVHGFEFMMFRTFHNIGNNANLAVHCFYKALEKKFEASGEKQTRPNIVYLQVDGGPENANATLLAACELLVLKGFVKSKVVYTRLPRGHTHEGIFSNLFAI